MSHLEFGKTFFRGLCVPWQTWLVLGNRASARPWKDCRCIGRILNSQVEGTFRVNIPPVLLGYHKRGRHSGAPGSLGIISRDDTLLTLFITIEPPLQPSQPLAERVCVPYFYELHSPCNLSPTIIIVSFFCHYDYPCSSFDLKSIMNVNSTPFHCLHWKRVDGYRFRQA